MPTLVLYAHSAPAHDGALYVAPRPLPGRLIGRAGSFVYDVTPAFEDDARTLHGQRVILITPEGLERLAEQLLTQDGGRYTRADYEAAGEWDAEDIARNRGHAVIAIRPEPDAGPLIHATAADDLAAGCPGPRYVTVTAVVRVNDPSDATDCVLAAPNVMWLGAEEGVTTAALAGGAEPGDWPPLDDDQAQAC